MAGSKDYKAWVWVQGTSTSWREVVNHTNLVYEDGWGAAGSLSLVAYDKGQFALPWDASKSLRDLLVPGAIIRLTKRFYSSGAAVTNPDTVSPNDPLVREFFLLEPGADDKTLSGGKASVYNLKCAGPGEAVRAATVVVTRTSGTVGGVTFYSNSAARGTLDNLVTYYLNDATDGFNQRAGGVANQYLVKGTIDTPGITLAVKAKNEQLWDHLFDLSGIGDTTTKFPLQVWIDFQNSGSGTARLFKPRINILKSNNTTFAFPFAHTGYATSDPFAGPTESRILDEKTELTDLVAQVDKARVLNKAKVRFAGAGTQAPQGETAFVTNANSVTAFGTRETRSLDPWIQQDTDPGTNTTAGASLTADTRCATLVNLYSGIDPFTLAAVGIVTATAVAKSGELYSSAFNAVLGDTVGVRDRNGAVAARGRLLGIHYTQESENLAYVIGLPPVKIQGAQDEFRRRLKQRVQNLSVTKSAASSSFTGSSAATTPPATVFGAQVATFGGTFGPGATSSWFTSTFPGGGSLSAYEGVVILFSLNVSTSTAGYHDWNVDCRLGTDAGDYQFLQNSFHMKDGATANLRVYVSAAELKFTTATLVNQIKFRFSNDGTNNQTIGSVTLTADLMPGHTHNLSVPIPSHDHNV